jgi:hypothetical protein
MKKHIKKLLRKHLNEVRYINTNWKEYSKEQPIKDDEVLRVFHGFSGNAGFNEALYTVLHGLSGKERARRIYSYESGNNPKGLFVSVDFNVVKRTFAGSGVIIEFSAKVSDLEAPVWAGGGSYFVQGQFTKSFKDDKEREQQRLQNRDREATNKDTRISKSDRPELGQTIFDNGERQALFIGDLNPNMIKYVWYNEVLHKERRTNGEWVRYTRKDFINKFKPEHDEATKSVEKRYSDYKSSRMFKPNEDFDENTFIERLEAKWGKDTYDRWLKYELDHKFSEYYLKNYFWPKQMQQAKEFYQNKFPDLEIE